MNRYRMGAFSGVLVLVTVCAAAGASCGGTVSPGDPSGTGAGGNGGNGNNGGSGGLGGDFITTGSMGTSSIQSLVFDPPTATLMLDGVTPGSASYTLRATYSDGSSETVVAQAIQFDRPDLASVAPGLAVVLTSPGEYGGTGTLHGVYGGIEATAKLTISVHRKEYGAGVDPTMTGGLDQSNLPPDPALSSILYPYDGTVFPQGLASPLVMWTAPAANDVYRVHYEQTNYAFDGYYAVSPPASLRMPQLNWDKMVASNGGEPIKFELSRLDAATGMAYSSTKQTWPIAPASLRGAIYYWTTSGTGEMARINPGGSWEALNGGACMGCHAVSSDGSTLVAAWEGQPTIDNDPRAWVSFDLPSGTVRKISNRFAGNVAVNNDGKYVVFGSQTLKLAETATGTEFPNSGLENLPLLPGMNGLMTPAFSPDGLHMTAVEGAGNWYHNLVNGRLVTMDFDPTTQKFSNYKGLVNASEYPAGQQAIAYPSFAPDSKWIAYHVSDYATGCDVQGCDDFATQIGSIAMQNVDGTPAVNLEALSNGPPNAADRNRAFEPTFNPIERGGYFWVVFTSMRDYGHRVTGVPNNGKKRLWVAAIDKNPQPGIDPSHPAFFLEGQNEATTNMRGFWALSPCIPSDAMPPPPCTAGFECCSGFCDDGVCVTPQDFSCVGAGEDCTNDADCCNGPLVTCVTGKCVPQTPK
jgi:hypothetical protein